MLRKIVHIDEEKCDGCGLCVEACAEGAIAVIDGKARLVSESYCDGLGACLGECPRGAITVIEREATPFDERAVKEHFNAGAGKKGTTRGSAPPPGKAGRRTGGGEFPADRSAADAPDPLPCGCPGTMARELETPGGKKIPAASEESRVASHLRNWPIQLRLLPVTAPLLKGAHLLLAADCTAFAFPEFHRELLEGKVLLVGCPKLDDAFFYREKLASVIAENQVREITTVHMEVPCCFGLVTIARRAIEDSGVHVRLTVVKLGINGEVLAREEYEGTAVEKDGA